MKTSAYLTYRNIKNENVYDFIDNIPKESNFKFHPTKTGGITSKNPIARTGEVKILLTQRDDLYLKLKEDSVATENLTFTHHVISVVKITTEHKIETLYEIYNVSKENNVNPNMMSDTLPDDAFVTEFILHARFINVNRIKM